MTRTEALAYLTRCADEAGTHWSGGFAYPIEDCTTCDGTNDAGHLYTPGSRYGRTSRDCAPVAYRACQAIGDTDPGSLSHMMGLVVNDHDDPEGLIRRLPHPERYL